MVPRLYNTLSEWPFERGKIFRRARPTRLDLPGAWYHALNRGIDKRTIYRADRCCERFLELLSQLPGRFGLRLHGYVLNVQPLHLQVETQEANLSRAIDWLNTSYDIWFNRKYHRVGPLFQGRFRAILHEPTEALAIICIDAAPTCVE
jgi:putative transposase